LIEERNRAEGTLNGFKEDLEKYSDQITDEERATAEDAVKALEDAMSGDDVKLIQDTIPKLYQAMNPVTAKKNEAEEAAKKAEEQAKKDAADGVVDAEAKETV
jgi:molecular chaperone DnaK (HSP70)